MSRLDDLYDRFPALSPGNHRITSSPSDEYNCVAWVRRRLNEWWEPGFCWPSDLDVPEVGDLDAYLELFRRWGYEPCAHYAYEPGYLKIAVYADSGDFFHVAKQLRDGTWSSKAGLLHDLKHQELGAFEDSFELQFARAMVYMRCPDDEADPMTLELGQLLSP